MTILIVVTILILIDGFLQFTPIFLGYCGITVTILILIDGFLQFNKPNLPRNIQESHNPYFNRWFSAI